MIKVLGHRGCIEDIERYQNTPPAFEYALHHADGLETDVTVTSDNDLVMVHDVFFGGDNTYYMVHEHLIEKDVAKLKERRLDQMTLKEIKTLQTHNAQSFPTLSEFLNSVTAYPKAQINIELKSDKTAEICLKQCEEAVKDGKIKREQIMISSFNYPELLICREQNLGYRLSFLVEPSVSTGAPMQKWLPESKAYFTPLSESLLKSDIAQQIKPWSINIEESDLTPDNIRMIKSIFPEAKIIIWWWAHNPEPMPQDNESLRIKIDYLEKENLINSLYAIISNHPKEMKEMITALGY